MTVLSELLLSPNSESVPFTSAFERLQTIDKDEFDQLMALASSNHVIVRSLQIIVRDLFHSGDEERAAWAAAALSAEQARIRHATEFLSTICGEFDRAGLDITVIKSLDHSPDLGSDLDLYTNASPRAVCSLMSSRFEATLLSRSWGDRLACKWNFMIPGLPELIEVHVGRLGQTGELVTLAEGLPARAQQKVIEGRMYPVPSPPDRILISVLQRMYRHFYFRLSDIVNSAGLIASGSLDFEKLRSLANLAGIWDGAATYLLLVSDYVQGYSGTALDLPDFVKEAAGFGGELMYFNRDFLRVPILPHSARLYRTQLSEMLRRREFHGSARLGLLPWLATAAAVGQKLTGSDKGIW